MIDFYLLLASLITFFFSILFVADTVEKNKRNKKGEKEMGNRV